MTHPAAAPLDLIAALLSGASRIAVLTGAGMSAESGIPPFRGARLRTLWRADPAGRGLVRRKAAAGGVAEHRHVEGCADALVAHVGHCETGTAIGKGERVVEVTANLAHLRDAGPGMSLQSDATENYQPKL